VQQARDILFYFLWEAPLLFSASTDTSVEDIGKNVMLRLLVSQTFHQYVKYSGSGPADNVSAVVLNRGYTYHLGVRGAKAGGTKHQSLQGYTLWKFKPDFIEHSS